MIERSVVLSEQNESMIEALVESGRFSSVNDVVREGLRLIESREGNDIDKLAALRAALQVGVDDLERGDFLEFSKPAALAAYLDEAVRRATSDASQE